MASMITIGTDTEIFARDKMGRAIALCGKIGGSKEEPKQLKLGKGFCVQEDNVAVEFNIPPVNSVDYWNRFIEATLKEVSTLLASMSLYFTEDVAISFDKDQLIHPNALVFGCEPDYNAWTKMENSKPTCDNPALRTAGGHIHVGTRGNIIHAVEAMDLFLGVPSVLLDDSPASMSRRTLYGKAGAMRPKSYGFEYRVLSNFWVFSELTRTWVFHNTARAVSMNKIPSKYAGDIQACINNGDKDLAKKLITEFSIPMPNSYKKEGNQPPQEGLSYPNASFIDWYSNTILTQSIIIDDPQS